MFGPAGCLYVYRSYGIHWCMNVVTQAEGTASAVLLRAADVTLATSGGLAAPTDLLRGPGNLTRGLGITGADNGIDCCAGEERLRFVRGSRSVDEALIGRSPRVGLSRGKERLSRYFLTPEIAK
jgi:DNA-3-methyladenine glycosylase